MKVKLFLCLLLMCTKSFSQASYEILITEIFADPTPSHGLPEKEYLEIFNNTAKTISLVGFRLFYATSEVEFPAYNLESGSYLIVCRENNVALYEPYGEVIGLSKFSLLNGGTTLRIEDSQGALINEVTYSSTWYAPDRDQGYSLELTDLNSPCREKGNWTSSAAEIGGTPGMENQSSSNTPDTDPPFFVSYDQISETTYVFVFSEKLTVDESILELSSDAEIEKVEISKEVSNGITIKFKEAINDNELIEIVFESISDCSGNLAEPISINIGNINSPEKGDLLLSEILFNPLAGSSDFVEVYNNSNKLINLKGLGVSSLNKLGEIETANIAFEHNQIVKPDAILCLSENITSLKLDYPKAREVNLYQVKQLPAFNNESGVVLLLNKEGAILDSLTYHEDMHHSFIDNPDGVSLERRVLSLGLGNENWQSSSAAEGFATPGYIVHSEDNDNGLLVEVAPQAFTPNNDEIEDDLEITVHPSEAGSITVSIYNLNGALVKTISRNEYINGISTYYWSGQNESNHIAPIGYYILFVEFRNSKDIFQNKQKVLLGSH